MNQAASYGSSVAYYMHPNFPGLGAMDQWLPSLATPVAWWGSETSRQTSD